MKPGLWWVESVGNRCGGLRDGPAVSVVEVLVVIQCGVLVVGGECTGLVVYGVVCAGR